MTSATSLQLLLYAFTLITLLGLAALLWQVVRTAPARMRVRLTREVTERRAAMVALAAAHARTDDAPLREALARNYRFHQAAVRALDPSAITDDLPLR
ncbi:hypothetical protein [Glacieibacterium frigidum]|uniref:Uncharacterized protein n=1 Tax=Glacieibacterium frigidum TaxID=2593303 RepID=A0A552UIS7_9SPHN|nr:hypothetical protein [Glacieibacterium frigidum]TRW18136.1 hypothetical protein FMM06_08525 [Glacieibacterium frigidum]